jgi:ribosome-interacting GTPase 1
VHVDVISLYNVIIHCTVLHRPPDVYFRAKKEGGVKFNTTVPLTHFGDDPGYAVKRILAEYKIHNCDLLLREVRVLATVT